ncbi:hypothetical protein L6249_00510 [Candidatus Parcubacteria bacterium]|nr:hypothetical protein [Candidatus Parcubacteria bacterium]
MMVAGLAQAATDSVTATVTVMYSSVSLNNVAFAYGSMANNTASSTLTLWSGAGIIATNNGSTSQFDIYGANTANYTLAANNTGNNYIHKFCNDTVDVCTGPPTSYTALTTSLATLDASVANGETVAFQLQITTPATPTNFAQQSAAVTIQASAI